MREENQNLIERIEMMEAEIAKVNEKTKEQSERYTKKIEQKDQIIQCKWAMLVMSLSV